MIGKVVIVGRDAPLWLTVLALHDALTPAGVAFEVVELPAEARFADVHATLPALEPFHRRLGVDEHDLLKFTGGSYALGQMFSEFGTKPFFHPYGSHGAAIGGVPFIQAFAKARRQGMSAGFEDFSLTAAAARHGRFVVPDDETEAFARTDYGYHLPAQAYAARLKRMAARLKLIVHAADAVTVERDADGDVVALDVRGTRVQGDLFIDTSGRESCLLRSALGAPFESWRPWFPGSRRLTALGPRLRSLPPYGHVQAADHGWLGLFACQDTTRVIYVFDGQDDAAAAETAARLSNLHLSDIAVAPLEPGRSEPWSHNIVAIGEAACSLDSLDGVGLHAVQLGIVHLLATFPLDRRDMPERAQYNRVMRTAIDNLRDFQLVHHALGRRESPFWRRARAAAIPPALQPRIDAFAIAGLAPVYDEDSFAADSWHALFVGHGLLPAAHDPRVELTSDAVLKSTFGRMFAVIRQQVEQATPHDDYIAVFCTP